MRVSYTLFALLATCMAAGMAQHVHISTNMGSIEVELLPEKAPITVRNFLTYVREGHYNGLIFHRVIRGFMIQGGGYDSTFRERATHAPIKNEADNGLLNKRGTLAMARTADINSATSQFFINHANNAFLDHGARDFGYCVFGRVVSGMDVVDRIANVQTGSKGPFDRDVPLRDVVIESINIIYFNIPPSP